MGKTNPRLKENLATQEENNGGRKINLKEIITFPWFDFDIFI